LGGIPSAITGPSDFEISQPFTMYFVHFPVTTLTQFYWGDIPAPSLVNIYISIFGVDLVNLGINSVVALSSIGLHIDAIVADGTSSQFKRFGSAQTAESYGTRGIDHPILLASPQGVFNTGNFLEEVIYFEGAHTASQVTDVQAYLASEWIP